MAQEVETRRQAINYGAQATGAGKRAALTVSPMTQNEVRYLGKCIRWELGKKGIQGFRTTEPNWTYDPPSTRARVREIQEYARIITEPDW